MEFLQQKIRELTPRWQTCIIEHIQTATRSEPNGKTAYPNPSDGELRQCSQALLEGQGRLGLRGQEVPGLQPRHRDCLGSAFADRAGQRVLHRDHHRLGSGRQRLPYGVRAQPAGVRRQDHFPCKRAGLVIAQELTGPPKYHILDTS